MKKVLPNINNFQNIYVSELAELIFFYATLEIFELVLTTNGGKVR